MGWVVALLASGALGVMWWQCRRLLAAGRLQIAKLTEDLATAQHNQSAEAANLRSILESMTEGVMVVDSAQVIRLANRSLMDLLELRANPIGQTVLQSVRDISFQELINGTFLSAQPRQTEISPSHIKPTRNLAVEAMPIQNPAHKREVLVICRDITRLKQLEDVRREFVANVSHELRTPLAIFQGYLENLLDNPDIPCSDLVEVLEILKRHSTRLNALVEDLLDLARLESRSEILCLEPVDPRALFSDIVADWRLRAKEKDIQLSVECANDVPAFEADASRIEQVFSNLVENALKYTEAGGTVRLRVAPCSSGVEFRVEDTGTGIPPQDLPHIFERFYRADKARTREHGGTGLGLSIVKHIAQLHDGTIRAESTYGKGTAVIMTLPVRHTCSSPTLPNSTDTNPSISAHSGDS